MRPCRASSRAAKLQHQPFSLFSETSFERFRIRSLEGRVFLPARRWCANKTNQTYYQKVKLKNENDTKPRFDVFPHGGASRRAGRVAPARERERRRQHLLVQGGRIKFDPVRAPERRQWRLDPRPDPVQRRRRPCGIALNPAAGKIYWANWDTGEIRVANLDGTGERLDPVRRRPRQRLRRRG